MSFDPDNDADWDTMVLQEQAQNAANGVCSLCEEALDPHDPRWADVSWPPTRLANGTTVETTADDMAAWLGPVHPDFPLHVRCVEEPARP